MALARRSRAKPEPFGRGSGDVAGVRPSSITGIRNAMLAVLREAALQTVSEILLERRRHYIRGALSSWHQNARRRQLQREHDRAVVVAAESTERLRKQHSDEDALTRQRWKQEREVLVKQIGEEPSEEDVRRLLQLDSQHRSHMSVLGDRQQRAHQEHHFAHAQVQKGHKKNLKVMALAALEAMVKASPEKRSADVRLSEGSPSVCFLQWAFTEHPEVWSVPFPPAADLMHAMAQTEQCCEPIRAFFTIALAATKMGKQGFDSRTALANALNASGKAKAAPPKKEVVKEPPKPTVSKVKKAEPEPPPKSKKEIEEEQKKLLEEMLGRLCQAFPSLFEVPFHIFMRPAKEEQKQQFFAAEQARKVAAAKGADKEVTYVEDRDTRKPKAVSDISDYWKADLGLLPFMPTDNVAESDLPDDVDPSFRLKYLEILNEKLEKILRLKFHVFWSQVIFDPNVSRLVDSYLRFCLRAHDLEGMEDAGVTAEEQAVTREVSRRMLQLLVRLSRPQESPSDYLSHDKYGQVILESQVLDVPKIIDVCVIYGDANRSTVTKIVHSAFRHQPLFKDDFSSVVQHMLDGLLQCCAPLQFAARGQGLSDQDLSVNECLSFLPDMLSCFNAIFCFFPEDCVDKLRAVHVPAAWANCTGGPGSGIDGKELAVRPESLVLATDVPDDVKMQEREEEEEFEESEEEEDEFEDDDTCDEASEDACGVDAAPASEAPNASPLQPSVFWCYGCSES
eukprot:s2919_g2.t1